MNTLDELIDNLAVELAALDAAEAEYGAIHEDEMLSSGRVRTARERVHKAQEKIHAAVTEQAEKRAAELAAKKLETEGDEITPETLVKLGFKAVNGRRMTFRSGIGRHGVEVHFEWEYKFDYAAARDPGDDELVIASGVKNLADLRELYRLVTGETLGEASQ